MLQENPILGDGYPIESSDPRRPSATEERYRATLDVAEQVHPFFHTLLVLANETGRRIGALRHLRYSDLLLDEGEHGKIHFPAEFDKESIDSTVPISAPAERAVRRHLRQFPGIGKAWLFPHPEKAGKPVTRWYPNKWLAEAEERAGLEPLDGKSWHAYRAKFATDLLDAGVSPVHVAKLGGWESAQTVLDIYGQPTDQMLASAHERRERSVAST